MMETKRCSGYRGHWECVEDYPDGMVPVNEFYRSLDGLQGKCFRCDKYRATIQWTERPRHPVTGQVNRHWKEKVAKGYGGVPGTPEWQSYLDRAGKQWKKEVKEWKINDKAVNTAPRHKSEFGQSTPMTKRETTVVEGEQVPEGWVYVVYNPDVPSVLKIGKTFPDGIPSIMSSARRFGRAELADKFWFDRAYKAEQAVHTALSSYNLRTLGYADCGVELFKCNIEEVRGAIENERTVL
jgi:hypothetical protein